MRSSVLDQSLLPFPNSLVACTGGLRLSSFPTNSTPSHHSFHAFKAEMMAVPNTDPRLVADIAGVVKLYSDGSVIRIAEPLSLLPPLQLSAHPQVLHKDVVLEREKGLWVRIYLPPQSASSQRLPVIVYVHGGGFCLLSAATAVMHNQCLTWASSVNAIVVSVNYRLAPEHRLPAAYDDSIAALRWLHSQSTGDDHVEPWLKSCADFSNVFVAGESAGGNIAHHVGVWAADPGNKSLPIRGLVLLYPFWGGEKRTASELRGGVGMFGLEMADAMWRCALPPGSDRDHPFSNPLSPLPRSHEGGIGSGELKLPAMLFVIAGRDILSDRQLEYCEELKKGGEEEVEMHVFAEEDHGFTVMKMDHPNSLKVVESIRDFIKRNC